MALGDTYATLPELKAYLLRQQASQTVDDDELQDALNSVSREIERECGRQFNDAGSATARLVARDWILYDPDRGVYVAWVDDFHTTTGLVVEADDGDDGTYSTTWGASDYQLEPLDGVRDGVDGWPYYRIVPVGDRDIPTATRRAPMQVTAQWGWATVPPPVKQACLILAAETAKLRDAPFGVAGFDGFGAVRVRDNPMAMRKLAPYMRDRVLVA